MRPDGLSTVSPHLHTVAFPVEIRHSFPACPSPLESESPLRTENAVLCKLSTTCLSQLLTVPPPQAQSTRHSSNLSHNLPTYLPQHHLPHTALSLSLLAQSSLIRYSVDTSSPSPPLQPRTQKASGSPRPKRSSQEALCHPSQDQSISILCNMDYPGPNLGQTRPAQTRP